MQTWKILDRKTILNAGKFLSVEQHRVQLPDGQVIPDWTWVITPDFVIVVAVTHNHEFVCFRQVKYAVQGTSLAPVGGYLDPGEDALSAAQRELREETGYAAETWTALGSFPVDANRGVGTAHLYLAQGARRVAEPQPDDLEEQDLLLLSRSEVQQALREGEFKVLPWAAAIALALGRM